MPDHLHALPAGYKLNEYRLERVLGSGGFGITYYAWDENLNKPVAIKEYLPSDFAVRTDGTSVRPKSDGDAGDYQWGLTRFLDEARALARFDHPHLNQVHRFFKAHGTAYLVLDYIDGETLAQMLGREGKLSEAPLRRLLGELLSGLEEVHRAGYVHRDVKPGNIMFRADGSTVLLDFGAARQVIGAKLKSVTAIHTPGYAPVEQYDQKADDVGAWSDIYALGMVAYRCVSGIGESGLIDAVTRSRLERKGELEKDMKPAVVVGKGRYAEALLAAIDWAIKIDETERPQSVAAMRSAIESAKAVGASEAAADGASEDEEAAKWYRKAAEQRNAIAQNNLGTMYYNGKGVTKNYAEAVKWYRKAAEQGNANAQPRQWYVLGELRPKQGMYVHGYGVTKDHAEAAKWYRKAAEQGNAFAQKNLGVVYGHGYGVTQDYAEALKWYRKAADQGNALAQNNLGDMYRHRPKALPKTMPKRSSGIARRQSRGMRMPKMTSAGCTAVAKALLKTMPRRLSGFARRQIRGVRGPKTNSARCTKTAKALPETMLKPSSGIAKLQIRGMRGPNSTLVGCTKTAKALPKANLMRASGMKKPRHKAKGTPRKPLKTYNPPV